MGFLERSQRDISKAPIFGVCATLALQTKIARNPTQEVCYLGMRAAVISVSGTWGWTRYSATKGSGRRGYSPSYDR